VVVRLPTSEADQDRRWAVVFGSADSSSVDLTGGSERVTTLRLPGPDLGSGDALAQPSAVGVGDVNADGRDDIAVGTPNNGGGPGGVYVVTKLPTGGEVSLDELGGDGFTIDGSSRDGFGGVLSRAGDFNGDKIDDFAVGAPYTGGERGRTYVIFGTRDADDFDIGSIGDRGIVLTGALGGQSGGTLAGPGDLSGDGLADLAIGAPFASPDGRDRAGVTYVVFGRRDQGKVDLSELGSGGFRIDGQGPALYEQSDAIYGSATTLAPAGDANGDGTPDLVVSGTTTGSNDPAPTFVVYGKSSSTHVDLGDPGGQAVALEPPSGGFLRAGEGADFDGDNVFEVPFILGGEGHSVSDGYLIKVKR
jgi:hypothetical protein